MEPAPTACKKPATALPRPLPLPPALLLVRARSRASRAADQHDAAAARWPAPPDTPPRRSPVTVPFLWEEAPGKPKAAAPGPVLTAKQGGGGEEDKAQAEEAPLRLPPRLQRVAPSPADASATSLPSPTSVLQGPYYGCAGGGGEKKRPAVAAFRRTPSAGAALFSRARSKLAAAGGGKNRGGGHGRGLEPDAAPWGSPAASSSSAASSLSASCFGDDHGHRRPGEGHDEECSEEDDGAAATGYVRITRFRRNRSLPTIVTTSHLWASIRRSVKQMTPWS
ncbi:hypothetical protein U9M48_018780 [Paspalum notatum var. saurae]|uniref:Uncharacterized protein n=1 Tax=Paspalum notatum var. saurae TaxID=547442 RepID=A0AAQ3TE85_PASNO